MEISKKDQKVQEQWDIETGEYVLLIKKANSTDSGQYNVKITNKKGQSEHSVTVKIGYENEEEEYSANQTQMEVLTIHEVSERSEDQLATTTEIPTLEAIEPTMKTEAKIRDKVREAVKLLVVDNEIEEEKEAGKNKSKKKRTKVVVPKGIVTIHEVDEQVIGEECKVKEIVETVSGSELEGLIEEELSHDSLHKLEPFLVIEKGITSGKRIEDMEEEDGEEENDTVLMKEVKSEYAVGKQLTQIETTVSVSSDTAQEVIDIQEGVKRKSDKKRKKKEKKKLTLDDACETKVSFKSKGEKDKSDTIGPDSEAISGNEEEAVGKPMKPINEQRKDECTEKNTQIEDQIEDQVKEKQKDGATNIEIESLVENLKIEIESDSGAQQISVQENIVEPSVNQPSTDAIQKQATFPGAPIILNSPKPITAEEGQIVKLSCRVKGQKLSQIHYVFGYMSAYDFILAAVWPLHLFVT